jgi:molecular chaperone DnaK (HSP70)
MSENISEVIGFDLGHGETALAHIFMNDTDKTSEPELLEIFAGKKNIITAIGYHPTRGILVGRSALKAKGIVESHIAFKRKPSNDPEYQRVMSDYIRMIYETQIEQGRIKETESFFIVGCPSEWTKYPAIVSAYEKLFSDAGIQRVKVVAESRAAYIHAVEKGIVNMAQLKNSLIVIDIGSSTTDITFIDQNKNSIPIDLGRDLGASLIDKAILQRVINNFDRDKKTKLENIFSQHSYLRNECELACRDTKEAYFAEPENYQMPGDYAPYQTVKISDIYFEPEVDGNVMNEILNTPIVNLGSELETWPAAFMNELIRLKQELEIRQQFGSSNDFSGAILLTGGASRMDFVQEICKKVFPQASLGLDKTPEYCIARGLARWGRVEINTSQFSQEVEIFCSDNIKPEVTKQIDSLYEAIASALADSVINIIKRNFDSWKNRDHKTVNNMKYAIDKDIKSLLQGENLSKLYGKETNQMLAKISQELRNDIKALEVKYNVPIGKLGESFDLKNLTVGSISLGTQSNIDATDGLISEFSNIVSWISGVLAGVVSYAVAPVILGIIIYITALISTTLAGLLFAILTIGSGGGALLVVLGLAVFGGTKAKDTVKSTLEEKMPSWDLPMLARDRIESSSVYSKINDQHTQIVNEISAKLKGEEKIRQELSDNITTIFEESLKAKAEDMKALIN